MRIIVVAPAFPPGQIIDPSTLRESEELAMTPPLASSSPASSPRSAM
jgi:hypothetical protein